MMLPTISLFVGEMNRPVVDVVVGDGARRVRLAHHVLDPFPHPHGVYHDPELASLCVDRQPEK